MLNNAPGPKVVVEPAHFCFSGGALGELRPEFWVDASVWGCEALDAPSYLPLGGATSFAMSDGATYILFSGARP